MELDLIAKKLKDFDLGNFVRVHGKHLLDKTVNTEQVAVYLKINPSAVQKIIAPTSAFTQNRHLYNDIICLDDPLEFLRALEETGNEHIIKFIETSLFPLTAPNNIKWNTHSRDVLYPESFSNGESNVALPAAVHSSGNTISGISNSNLSGITQSFTFFSLKSRAEKSKADDGKCRKINDGPKVLERLEESWDFYNSNKKKAAVLLVVNLFEHDRKKWDLSKEGNYRAYATEDLAKMKDLFEDLNCDVYEERKVVAEDEMVSGTKTRIPRSRKLDIVIREFQEDCKRKDYGSCFIVLSSHQRADRHGILMEDDRPINLFTDLIYKFNDENFVEFKDKPKIFIVDASLQFLEASSSSSFAKPVFTSLQQHAQTIPDASSKISNALVCHVTSQHNPRLVVKGSGSVFLHHLDKVFRAGVPRNSSLFEMLNHVSDYVKDEARKSSQTSIQIHPWTLFGFKNYRFVTDEK